MKIWQIIAFSAPLSAVLLILWLEQRQEVAVRLERAEVQSRIDEQKFDREFREFSGLAPTASAEQAERLVTLERQRDDLDSRLRANLQRLDTDSLELRQAIEQLDTPSTQPRRQK